MQKASEKKEDESTHTSLCHHLWHPEQSTFLTSLLRFSEHSSGVKRTRISSQAAAGPRL